MSTTVYIYPLEQHCNKDPAPLSPTGLSRILEIPLSLLDDPKNVSFNDPHQQQQLYWLTNAHKNIDPIASSPKEDVVSNGTSELVTHSFANRKRSIVKRRKSVLSASFTAEDEAEAIRVDRQDTLAVLEKGQQHEEKGHNEEIEEMDRSEPLFQSSLYSQNNLTFEVDQNSENCFHSSFRGDVEQDKKEEEEKKKNKIDKEDVPTEIEGASVVSPKDSAIDLRTTALEQEVEEPHDVVTDTATKVIDLAAISPHPSYSPAASYGTASDNDDNCDDSIAQDVKKKKSSWSPRKIFSSNTAHKLSKKKSTASLNSIEDPAKERFQISSLFSRKSSSLSTKKSKKSIQHESDAVVPEQRTTKPVLYNYTRLPIHTERAIYRLSHMKLTNPRRPLRDQVIISNLMFWYLSIVASSNNSITENEPAPIDTAAHLVMTKKACRMRQQHKKRRMRNQIRPENSNAMDLIHQPVKPIPNQHHINVNNKHKRQPNYEKSRHIQSNNNSSSDEDSDEEEEEDSDDEDSDDSDRLSFVSTASSTDSKKPEKKKKKKYSIFGKNKNSSKGWLSSFSSNKQQHNTGKQDEDDIPLAMYQKGKGQ